jgi:hypothetical protein
MSMSIPGTDPYTGREFWYSVRTGHRTWKRPAGFDVDGDAYEEAQEHHVEGIQALIGKR